MKRFIFVFCFISIAQPGNAQSIQYKPGAGLHFYSAEEQWKLYAMGYIQSTFNYFAVNENKKVSNEFFVRRSVLDIGFDYKNTYHLFTEMDFRGEKRAELVIAQLDIEYAAHHHFVFGKFMTPFSPENHRSSRGLTTVERYSALNSFFKLPAMTSQYGLMLNGKVSGWDYYLALTNGNGQSSNNIRENNNAKEVQARVAYHVNANLLISAGCNYAKEDTQKLSLYDHTFEPFSGASILGKRAGYVLFADWNPEPFSVRAEGIHFFFSDKISGERPVRQFAGGYVETGYFLKGNMMNGIQILGRFERAQILKTYDAFAGPKYLNSYILGYNWFFDTVFRIQTNFIYEQAEKASTAAGSRFQNKKGGLEILNMLQIKF